MAIEKISIQEARNLLLTAQGLTRPMRRRAKKDDVLAAIQRMKLLQIDSINVVARSHFLVLWSRLGDYKPEWLDELLAEGEIFEFWAHAACFLPREAYPLYRRIIRDSARNIWKDAQPWVDNHRPLVDAILKRIRREGPMRAADFETTQPRGGPWWNWRDEKTALECLWILGELMVARRQNFQRVYDLRTRVRPDWKDGPRARNAPSMEGVLRTFAVQTVQALGVAHAEWVPDYFRRPKTGNRELLESLADEGLIERVAIEGLPGMAYRDPKAKYAGPSTVTTVLSPFDPVIWDRRRLKELFNFDYTIEVYTPAAKRSFGYYTMPILHRGALVGRIDPKAHRALGQFEVRAIRLEPGVKVTEELVEELGAALRRLAAWHGTPEVVIGKTEPKGLGEGLRAVAADFKTD